MTELNLPPEPGTVSDTDHGIPGPVDALPENDAEQTEDTLVNFDVDDLDYDQEAGTDG